MTSGVDAWHKKAEGKTCIDYGFHLITTDFEDGDEKEMYSLMDEGITSFKLFMAYPGVFLADDATIFRAMSAAGKRGGLICMHAENGIVINEIIKRFLADGRTAPKYHALTRPTIAEAGEFIGRSRSPRWPSRRFTSCICPAPTLSIRFARRATAAFRHLPRRVRSICSTRSKITAMAGTVRNTL